MGIGYQVYLVYLHWSKSKIFLKHVMYFIYLKLELEKVDTHFEPMDVKKNLNRIFFFNFVIFLRWTDDSF